MTQPGSNSHCAITGWGVALPTTIVTNDDLSRRLETTDAWIYERTGIRQRFFANDDETTATLAAQAARAAIARAGLFPNDIGLMIVATCTPEQLMPHTGAFVGHELGLSCGSFDINAACSGFVYALEVAVGMARNGIPNVLVVGSETMSRIVDPDDRATAILFGDGAGAAVVSAHASEFESFLSNDLGCDGSATAILGVLAGGSKLPSSQKTLDSGDHFISMNGQEVFKRAVLAVVESCQRALNRASLTCDDVDWFIPHQANIRIITAAASRLNIAMSRTVVNLDRYGNTSSASIPLALFEAVDDGRIRPGDTVLACGFGAGLTTATSVLRWPATTKESR